MMRSAAAILALTLSTAGALAQTYGFTFIDPAPGFVHTFGTGISADGHSIAGYSQSTSNPILRSSFLWSSTAGRNDFGVPYSFNDTSQGGISGDGQVVAGGLGGLDAYRWSSAGGLQNLGRAAGWDSTVPGQMNGDGSVFVGYVRTPVSDPNSRGAFRWTQSGGYQVLPPLTQNATFVMANGVSRDGNVVVGNSQPSYVSFPEEAFRWTPSGGTQRLIPQVNPMFDDTAALAVSGDGNVIIGWGYTAFRNHAFRWTQSGGMQDLGMILGTDTQAELTNYDGSVMIETINVNIPALRTYIWRQDTGAVNFIDYLASYGISLPAGDTIQGITGISDDGLSFCGTMSTSPSIGAARAFIVTVPSPFSLTPFLFSGVWAHRRSRSRRKAS